MRPSARPFCRAGKKKEMLLTDDAKAPPPTLPSKMGLKKIEIAKRKLIDVVLYKSKIVIVWQMLAKFCQMLAEIRGNLSYVAECSQMLTKVIPS